MDALDGLTPREREVLDLLAEGLSQDEIATSLGCERRTVRSHCHHLYSKLRVASNVKAAMCVWQARLDAKEAQLMAKETELAALRQQFVDARKEFYALEFYLRRAATVLTQLGGGSQGD